MSASQPGHTTSAPPPRDDPAARGDQPTQDEGDWFHHAFGELYPLLYRHRDDEAARREIAALTDYLQLRGDERVLDVCCGGGRHPAALRQAGFDVLGLDLSMQLLRDAAQRPQLAGRLVRGDIRTLPLAPRFDLVLNLFSSFGYFEQERENRLALRRMAGALRPGGVLVLDHINPPALEHGLTPYSCERLDGALVEHHRWLTDHRVNKRTVLSPSAGHRRTFIESLRIYEPDEMTRMFHASGLREVRQIGGFDGQALTEHAPRMITIGVRP